MSTVVPVRLIRSSSSMIPSLVSGSRLPVGSSASSTSGRLTNARASAPPCSSPAAGRRAGPLAGAGGERAHGAVADPPGARRALLLTAGELVREPVGLAVETDHLQHLGDDALAGAARLVDDLEGGGHVLGAAAAAQ